MTIIRRTLFGLILLAAFEGAPALASSITVQPQTIPGVFDPRISASNPPHLRVFCSAGFQSNDVPPVFVPQGAPASGRYFQDIVCSYAAAGGVVSVPLFTLISTTDALAPSNGAAYTFTLYTSSGQELNPDPVAAVYYNIRVPPTIVSASGCSPAGHCADWRDLLIYSRGPLSPNIDTAAYTKAEVDAKILANIASQVPITAPFVLSTSVPGLTNAQVLGSLATGIPKVTTGTGLLSTAQAGTDYQAPISSTSPITFSSNTVACPTCLTGGPFGSGQLILGAGGQGLSALGQLGTANQVYHGNATGAGNFGPVGIGDVSGSTGTGNFVFSVSPVLTTPSIGAATAASVSGLTGPVTPNVGGGTTIGTAALPFGAVFVGNAANSSAQLTGSFTGNRTVTLPDANSVTVQPSSAAANQFATGVSSAGVVSYGQASAGSLSNGVTGSGLIVLQTSPTINSPTLTTPSLGAATATSISGLTGGVTPSSAGGTDIGSAVLPFGHLWLGSAATNNYQFIAPAATGARTVTVAADANSVTVVSVSAPANQFFNSLSSAGVLGSAQISFTNLAGTISNAEEGTTNTPQFAGLGLGQAAPAITVLGLTGAALNTQASLSVASAQIGGLYISNANTSATYYDTLIQPTFNGGVTNANKNVSILRIDSTNTSLTGYTVTPLDVNFGGSSIFKVSQVGNTTIGGTLGVAGNTTLSGTLAVTGNATISGNLSAANSLFTAQLQDKGGQVFNVKAYGAAGDGVTDDTTAIQNAVNAVPASGGIVYFPAGTYKVSSTLTVGNGGQSAYSTVNGIQLIGAGAGSQTGVITGYTTLAWYGSSGGTVITVAGPINHLLFQDIGIDCRSLAATGISWTHPQESRFVNLNVVNMNQGFAYVLTAISNPTGTANGANNNVFQSLMAAGAAMSTPGTNSGGIIIGANTFGSAPHLDAAQNVFINCRFRFDAAIAAGATGTVGIQLQFTDSSSFYSTITYAHTGLKMVSPTGSATFPAAYAFYNCPLTAAATSVTTSGYSNGTTPQISFYDYPRTDGEGLPPTGSNNTIGFDNLGNAFGNWAFLGTLSSGVASTTTGQLTLFNSGSANSTTLQAGQPSANITLVAPSATPTVGQFLTVSSVVGNTFTLGYTAAGSAGYSGSGANGQATFWTGTTSFAGSNNFLWDNTNNRLRVRNGTDTTAALQSFNGSTDVAFNDANNANLGANARAFSVADGFIGGAVSSGNPTVSWTRADATNQTTAIPAFLINVNRSGTAGGDIYGLSISAVTSAGGSGNTAALNLVSQANSGTASGQINYALQAKAISTTVNQSRPIAGIFTVTNGTGSDNIAGVPSSSTSHNGLVIQTGNNSNKSQAGIYLTSPGGNGAFQTGLWLGANSVNTTGIMFEANSVASGGVGIDLIGLTNLSNTVPIRLANQAFIQAQNQAGTANLNVIGVSTINSLYLVNDTLIQFVSNNAATEWARIAPLNGSGSFQLGTTGVGFQMQVAAPAANTSVARFGSAASAGTIFNITNDDQAANVPAVNTRFAGIFLGVATSSTASATNLVGLSGVNGENYNSSTAEGAWAKLETMPNSTGQSTAQTTRTISFANGVVRQLTNASATNIFDLGIASGDVGACVVSFTIRVQNATDVQTASGMLDVGAINKGGVLTLNNNAGTYPGAIIIIDPNVAANKNLSTGTLTVTPSVTTGTNKIIFAINANSSLGTITSEVVSWTVINRSNGTITPYLP
jgi:hypothetical protein